MREGLELVLDKIESRIGKREDFLVDDVLRYFLQDERKLRIITFKNLRISETN